MEIKRQIRSTPQVGYAPYRQIHPHSTGNPNSTAQNEADFMSRKDLNSGFYTHVVGNGQVIQTAEVGRGAYDVGGGWNYETYAAVELIQSHATRAEFERDYRLYVELLRQLAKEAGIPLTLDTKDLAGIKTHMFCTYNQPNNGSDHIDPYPYLNRWGVTVNQFERDLANGFSINSANSNSLTQKIEEDDIMYIYEVTRRQGNTEIWFMNGATRWYLPTDEAVATAEAQLKKYGRSTARMRFNYDNFQLKQLEKASKEVK